MSHVVEPGRRVVALDPELRLGQVAQEVPVARPVAPADPPALGHEGEELAHVLLAGSGTRSVTTIGPLRCWTSKLRLGSRPAVERLQISLLVLRQPPPQADEHGQKVDQSRQEKRSADAELVGRETPRPAPESHAAERRRLVERQRPPDHPARRGNLHRDVERRQGQDPARPAERHRRHGHGDAGAEGGRDSAGREASEGQADKPLGATCLTDAAARTVRLRRRRGRTRRAAGRT